MNKENEYVLEVNHLSVSFEKNKKVTKVIHDLSLNIKKGELVAVVGASGSGKSILAHAILGILSNYAKVTGEIKLQGEVVDYNKEVRGKRIALVPQSVSCLDPLMKVSKQVQGKNTKEKMNFLFEKYGLCERAKKLYPFQFSGGMARRALIATCEEHNPEVIIADEPTPGLDLELARKTLQYFKEMTKDGKAVLLITHDIDLALDVADKIAVFYDGTILEIADKEDFSRGEEFLKHAYTKQLFRALPQNDFNIKM